MKGFNVKQETKNIVLNSGLKIRALKSKIDSTKKLNVELPVTLNNAPAKSWWVCVSGLKVQPKHVGLTTCDRYQQTL
jgi:hypothetical protein